MLLHQPVIRHVIIKRANHIVAIAPHLLIREIELVSKRLRITHQVQPMPSPALAKMRACQQLIDQRLNGRLAGGRPRLFKLRNRPGRRWQPNQVKVRPPNQSPSPRRPGGLEAVGLQFREDEIIQPVGRPVRLFHFRRRQFLDRLPRPMLGLALGEIELLRRRTARHRFLWPRQAAFHPLGEGGNRLRRQLPARRHLEIHVVVFNGLHQPAGLRFSRHRSRAAIAALEHTRAIIQPQAALQLFRLRTVALETMFRQNRPHLLLKKLQVLRRKLCSCQAKWQQSGSKHKRELRIHGRILNHRKDQTSLQWSCRINS